MQLYITNDEKCIGSRCHVHESNYCFIVCSITTIIMMLAHSGKIHISVQTFIKLLPNERTHTLNNVCDPSVSAFIIYFRAQSSALQRKLDRTERTNRAPPLRTVIILIAQFRHRRMFNRSNPRMAVKLLCGKNIIFLLFIILF